MATQQKKTRVGMISLGCAKNQVDGEMLMAALEENGFELSDDVGICDIAIINTCGFIESAKKESIEEILELCKLKEEGRIQKMVVTGCLASPYEEELRREIPEVDAVLGIGANGEIASYLKKMWDDNTTVESFPPKTEMPLCGSRTLTTPSYYAYLKIAGGCSNGGSYCASPRIRGPCRSRPMESILAEAKGLAENGCRELVIIAQDTSRYGLDLYGELRLPQLLTELSHLENIRWIRLLYCYPDYITDELLTVIRDVMKVVRYIDRPLQHVSGKILKAMNRGGDRAALTEQIRHIREMVPGITLRTTLITGFPGETEEDFNELAEFVHEMKFERLGCFAYSQEEGTPAAALPDQLPQEVKEHREEVIMEDQMVIMLEKGEEMVGKTVEVLTEGFDRYAECYFGRTQADAPDVDGKVFFVAHRKKPQYGQFVHVKITECVDGDLYGELAR